MTKRSDKQKNNKRLSVIKVTCGNCGHKRAFEKRSRIECCKCKHTIEEKW